MEHNSDFSHDLVVGKLGERVVDKMYEGDRVEVKSEQDQWKNTKSKTNPHPKPKPK